MKYFFIDFFLKNKITVKIFQVKKKKRRPVQNESTYTLKHHHPFKATKAIYTNAYGHLQAAVIPTEERGPKRKKYKKITKQEPKVHKPPTSQTSCTP